MAIIVFGAKNRDGLRTEDIIELAKGIHDENGNPFDLIELMWNGSKNAVYAKTQGFEDTIIRRENRGITISYREPGACTWMRNAIGVFVGRVGNTPMNVKQLASMFYDELWTIKDPRLRAEVKALADKIDASLSPEQLEFETKRRKDLHRKAHERTDDLRSPTDSARENESKINMSDRFDVAQRNTGLDKREAAILEREARQSEREEKFAGEHGPTTRYQLFALQEKKLPQLRKILRDEFNIDTTNRLTKAKAIDLIEEAQFAEMAGSAGDDGASNPNPGEQSGIGNALDDTGDGENTGPGTGDDDGAGEGTGSDDDSTDTESGEGEGQQHAAESVTG